MTKSASEAAARPPDGNQDVVPTASITVHSGTAFGTSTVGIHAAKPSSRSDESPLGRKGPGGVTPACQKRAIQWSSEEIKELRRLATSNICPKGNVVWGKVEEAWRELGLPPRSKAGLSSKWTAIKKQTSTSQGISEETQRTQDSAESSESSVLISDVRPKEAPSNEHLADGPSPREVNPAVAIQPDLPPMVDTTEKVIEKTFKKYLHQARMIGCLPNKRKTPNKVSGLHAKPIVSEVDKLIEAEMSSKNGGNPSWNQLSILVYAGAMTVSEIGNQRSTEKVSRLKDWFKNTYREVDNLRKVIGKATAELNRRKETTKGTPTYQQTKNIRMLKKKYGVQFSAEITSLVERLKCRLQLLQSRMELRKADERRKHVRQTPTKVLLRGIEETATDEAPDVHQIRRFWKEIVGVKKTFNPNHQLVAWKNSMQNVKEEEDLRANLALELWQRVTHKSKSWKAPGPDGLQGYWWKAFKSASVALYQLAFKHLTSGSPLPEKWITEGRIILLHKSGSRSDPANFRPIACLNTCYKLLTGFIAAYLNEYVRERQIMPSEQVALRAGVWGCTHALTLDQTLVADAQYQKQRPISVAWIDYAKAFDSVPHSYIKWLLKVVQVPYPLRTFIKTLMGMWRVKYEVRGPEGITERSNYLRIRSGVLQGDSFSPLLFCLAMAPISHAINSVGGHYTTASGKLKKMQISLSHLFYMDDLKLFANSAESLSNQISAVASVSAAISMKLNVKKCAKVHFIPKRLQNKQVLDTGDLTIDGGASFPLLEGDSVYKYLGIEQKLGVEEASAWGRVEVKCCELVQKLWGSDLTFRQKVNSHNSTVIPVLSYVISCIIKGSGKYNSVLASGEKLDKKFRVILKELKVRYKSACVARLYLSTELGGCGLRSVRDIIEETTIYSWAYLCTKAELRSSLNLFVSMADRGKRCVVSDAWSVLKSYNINAEINVYTSRVTLNGAQFDDAKALARHVVSLMRTENNTRRYKEWQNKPLAGRVIHSGSDIDVETSFAWLRAGKLSSVAVRNVLAVQEGCLLTRAHPACANNTSNTNCRACRRTAETPEHIVSSCSKWLPTLYIDRHDSVARNIHYKLCQKYDLTPPHYSQKVEPVLENERVKLYWNQPVQTKTIIRHNKPDIIAFDKTGMKATIIEVAVSWFTGIVKQTEIKRNRYCVNGNWEDELALPYPRGDNLQRELQTSGWTVSFLPVVIGATGEVLSNLTEQIQVTLGLSTEAAEKCIERLQRSAVLGTSRIVKNHMADRST